MLILAAMNCIWVEQGDKVVQKNFSKMNAMRSKYDDTFFYWRFEDKLHSTHVDDLHWAGTEHIAQKLANKTGNQQ